MTPDPVTAFYDLARASANVGLAVVVVASRPLYQYGYPVDHRAARVARHESARVRAAFLIALTAATRAQAEAAGLIFTD